PPKTSGACTVYLFYLLKLFVKFVLTRPRARSSEELFREEGKTFVGFGRGQDSLSRAVFLRDNMQENKMSLHVMETSIFACLHIMCGFWGR
ncbi:hypothetical protein QUW15_12895, partial [Desulfovibrio piger]|nr:hypothetical protein [Desulfovibrio piger]